MLRPLHWITTAELLVWMQNVDGLIKIINCWHSPQSPIKKKKKERKKKGKTTAFGSERTFFKLPGEAFLVLPLLLGIFSPFLVPFGMLPWPPHHWSVDNGQCLPSRTCKSEKGACQSQPSTHLSAISCLTGNTWREGPGVCLAWPWSGLLPLAF